MMILWAMAAEGLLPDGGGPPKLTCKLRQRGRAQLELKLHYPLRRVSRQIFQTEVYVFAPDKLDLTAASYGVERVLAEIVLLLRHSSPRIPLEALVDPDVELSPLTRLRAIVQGGSVEGRVPLVVHELKTLVNAYRSESRTTVTDARRAVSRGEPGCAARVARAVELLVALPSAARELRARLDALDAPPEVARASAWADEGLSAIVAGALFRLLDALRLKRGLRVETARVRAALEAETGYRRRVGMDLGLRAGRSAEVLQHNEGVLLRIRALKRWSQSALFLGKKVLRENVRVGQVAAGTAAALAMSFAVVAAIFAQEHFAVNSLPWAFIVILSYILKDRIKEAVRTIIGAMIPRLLSDRSHALVDSSGVTAGLVREAVLFPRVDQVPAEVRDLRALAPAPVAELPEDRATGESVIYYRKWMRTRSSVLLRNHQRLERLTALVRWGVAGWLGEMDEAYSVLRSLEDDREVRGLARRVYHVHVVVRVREESLSSRLFLYRLALSREGIVRAEKIEPASQLPAISDRSR
jgi:hypothetical protein